jgi:hypothetical protein
MLRGALGPPVIGAVHRELADRVAFELGSRRLARIPLAAAFARALLELDHQDAGRRIAAPARGTGLPSGVPSIQRCACSHGCGSSSSGTTIETVPRRARKATPSQRQPRHSGNARAGQRDSIANMAKSVRGTSSGAVHRLNVAAGVGFIESVLRLIHAATEDDELTARQFRVLGHCVFGAGIDETPGYARGPSAAEPGDAAFIVRGGRRLAAARRSSSRRTGTPPGSSASTRCSSAGVRMRKRTA